MNPYEINQQNINRARQMAMQLQQQQPVENSANPVAVGLANMVRGLVANKRLKALDKEQDELTNAMADKRQAFIGSMGDQKGVLGKLLQSGIPEYENAAIQAMLKQQLNQSRLAPRGPVDPRAPWANISDPREIDRAKMRYGMQADKDIEKAREATDIGLNMNDRLKRFKALNKENYTGGGMIIPGAKTLRGSVDPGFREMQSIVDWMTPQMRQGMPGAASDRDVAMFRGATVGVEVPKEANDNIADALIARNQNAADRVRFMEKYRMEHGHLNTAEAEWREYINANPIFDHEKGDYTLNKDRLSYDEWKNKPAKAGGIKFRGYE